MGKNLRAIRSTCSANWTSKFDDCPLIWKFSIGTSSQTFWKMVKAPSIGESQGDLQRHQRIITFSRCLRLCET
ncbi:unnamed protein product [Allacma fusca]|uniref:Uncharacterized protein n=1 Tax=Allacma fusca TaxID=39272 RepID=A0A8J2NZV2_9HEXA|nr:unnamed protein product [Allacma fusca]